MNPNPSISKAFEKVVQDTQTAIIADKTLNWGTLPKKLLFMSGNLLEISNRLQSMTQSPNPNISQAKYPLIALLKDIEEDITKGLNGLETAFDARLLICTLSNGDDLHDTRRDKNFVPILEPIFNKLVQTISRSAVFGQPEIDSMKIKKVNRYFYGTNLNENNQFNDMVDAIEIKNISLKIKNNYC